jgi:hypothetical protein
MPASPRRPGFILRNVHLREFTQRQWPIDLDSSEEAVVLGYATSFGCQYDPENAVAAVVTKLDLVINDGETFTEEHPYTLAELETVTIFEVVEEDGVDDTLPIALDFIANLIGISYSTSRGIMIGRIPGERIERSPAPSISPRSVAKEMGLDWVSE